MNFANDTKNVKEWIIIVGIVLILPCFIAWSPLQTSCPPRGCGVCPPRHLRWVGFLKHKHHAPCILNFCYCHYCYQSIIVGFIYFPEPGRSTLSWSCTQLHRFTNKCFFCSYYFIFATLIVNSLFIRPLFFGHVSVRPPYVYFVFAFAFRQNERMARELLTNIENSIAC